MDYIITRIDYERGEVWVEPAGLRWRDVQFSEGDAQIHAWPRSQLPQVAPRSAPLLSPSSGPLVAAGAILGGLAGALAWFGARKRRVALEEGSR